MPAPSTALGLLALYAAAFVMAGPGRAAAEEKPVQRLITVTAAGQVSAEPDMARITSGVLTDGATAREALTRNSEAMRKLIEGLKANGIEAKDIQTSGLRIDPRYTNPREGEAPVISGYQVSNEVMVTARDLDKLGDVLDALVTLGANQMNGLSFEVSKAETLKDGGAQGGDRQCSQARQALCRRGGGRSGRGRVDLGGHRRRWAPPDPHGARHEGGSGADRARH